MKPIAIVGIGCFFPKAGNTDEYWSNIMNGVDTITDVPPSRWKIEDYYDKDPKAPDHTYCKRGGFVPTVEFNPMEFGISPNTVEATATSQLLALMAAKRAVLDAGYRAGRTFDRQKASVILGVAGYQELSIELGKRTCTPDWKGAMIRSGIDEESAEQVSRKVLGSYVQWQESSFPGFLGNVIAGRIANFMDLGGTNCVVDAACASSLSAMYLAMLELDSGKSDLSISGGVDTSNGIFAYMSFSKTPALSPSGKIRPFDRNADGTLLGEGVGIVVLKRLEDAERDGDRIYAVIRSMGSSSDGRGTAIFAPKLEGQVRAMREAYGQAGISPRTVELVEAHGTGTILGDLTEFSSLSQIYGKEGKGWCALGSVKSQIGHTKAAAGAASVIKAALALHHKVLPPTINVENPFEQVRDSPFYINTAMRPWMPAGDHPRRAAVSAFGFGGTNFHCVLEEYRPEKTAICWSPDVQIIALSGGSREELEKMLDGFDCPWEELQARAGKSRASFSHSHPHRLVIAAKRGDAGQIAAARRLLRSGPGSAPEGAYYGTGPSPGKLAVLFPGQGSQYTGMLADLSCRFPQMLEALQQADSIFGGGLAEHIYPKPAFDEQGRNALELSLRDTKVAQPALGAVCIGALRVLEYFGLKPSAYAGHSYGELPALCASGRISPESLHLLSGQRGRLMARSAGDMGSMLAVLEGHERIRGLLSQNGLNLVIANMNSPKQTVLSGPTAEIRRASEILGGLGISNSVLKVSAAFHSTLVSEASAPFARALEKTAMAAAGVPVYSNTTAGQYPDEPAKARLILAGQLASPVRFTEEIQRMHDDGVRIFLEVGPRSVLSGFVGDILDKKEHHAFSLDSSRGRDGMHDLAKVLSRLSSLGCEVGLRLWNPAYEEKEKAKMTIPIDGGNYIKPKPMEEFNMDKTAKPERPNAALIAQLEMLQKMHEQTARAHQQFLDTQMATIRAYQAAAGLPLSPVSESPPAPASPGPMQGGRLPPEQAKAPIPPPDRKAPQIAGPVPAAAAPGPSGGPALSRDQVSALVISIIAEKTGFPPEMLEMGMDMDKDLGIDSIKKVEIFSSVKDKIPHADQIKIEHLANLRTLNDVVDFISNFDPAAYALLPADAGPAGPGQAQAPPAAQAKKLSRNVLSLEPLSARESVMPGDKNFWIVDNGSQLGKGIKKALASRAFDAKIISLADGKAPEPPTSLGGLVIIAPEKADDAFIKGSFRVLRMAAPHLRKSKGVFATVTRMDGSFGMESIGTDPLGGGLAGFAKTASHEWPEVSCKAMDVRPDMNAAEQVAGELLLKGPIEVAISDGGPRRLRLVPKARGEGDAFPLKEGDVVIVSGGARGVTAECAIQLARKKPTLVLLGRNSAPEPEPGWLGPLNDESSIKKEIIRRTAGKVELREVEKEYRRIMANRESLRNISRMESEGAKVLYRSVDVRDSKSLESLREFSPIRGLIHGAGVITDKRIEDKSDEEFDRVYDTKVIGGRNLLKALEKEDLRLLVMFSSVSARFGRMGQVDYSVSNEVLNKFAREQARLRPGCKVVSFNWGPWDGGGMVSPQLKKVLEMEKIDLIPVKEGSEFFFSEVSNPESPVEVVVLGSDLYSSFERILTDEPAFAGTLHGNPAGSPAPGGMSTVLEGPVNTDDYPVLKSHMILGKAVVPMALMVEMFASAAARKCPGLSFSGFEDLYVYKGIILSGKESASVRVVAADPVSRGSVSVIPLEIRSKGAGKEFTNARASVILSAKAPGGEAGILKNDFPPYEKNRNFYQNFLFHGPDLQGIEQIVGSSEKGLSAISKTSPPPSKWLKQPWADSWAADPMALDVSFQLAAVWSREYQGAFSLPSFAGRYTQFRPFPRENVKIILRASRKSENIISADIEYIAEDGSLIARMERFESIFYPMLNESFINQLS